MKDRTSALNGRTIGVPNRDMNPPSVRLFFLEAMIGSEVSMPQMKSNYRNEVFVRVGDDTLGWIDATRGEEARSTYIRKLIEQQARRDLPHEVVQDDNLHAIAG